MSTRTQEKNDTCGWYLKPTDTSTILNFRGCAPLQYKGNVFEGTVPSKRFFVCCKEVQPLKFRILPVSVGFYKYLSIKNF